MNNCALTRLLGPALLDGMAMATLLGNDTFGWIAAGSTALIGVAVQRVRGTNQTCAMSPSARTDQRDTDHTDNARTR